MKPITRSPSTYRPVGSRPICLFSPGRRTGRPRSTDADRAILAATREVPAELGWGGCRSATWRPAGFARTTLHRHWAGKNERVVDTLAVLVEAHPDLPDLGSLQADIQGVVLRFAELLDRPETRTALTAVVAETTHDDALRLRIRAAIVDRQKHLVLLGRDRAQRRGELPPVRGAADPGRDDMIFDVVAGSVVHGLMVGSGPVDEDCSSPTSAGRAGRAGPPCRANRPRTPPPRRSGRTPPP